MPISRTIVQIFVSSPSDVGPEREILESVVMELNRTWSGQLDIVLELLKWEISTFPAFAEDAQSVINSQIGDQYDVFLGILWGRFGTPTLHAGSGTEEEFLRALERKNIEGLPEIMIYFKDSPIAPSKIDLPQLAKVKSFQERVSELGGLYATFQDTSGFESSLRSHLSAIARNFSQQNYSKRKNLTQRHIENIENKNEIIQEVDGEDLGLLDYLDEHRTRMGEMNLIIKIIADSTVKVFERIKQRGSEISKLGSPPPDNLARKVLKKMAADFMQYAETLKINIPLFSRTQQLAFAAMSNALVIKSEMKDNEIDDDTESLKSSLSSLFASIQGANESMRGFKETIGLLPRLTSELNKSKRMVVEQLNFMFEEFEKTEHTISNILDSIDKMS